MEDRDFEMLTMIYNEVKGVKATVSGLDKKISNLEVSVSNLDKKVSKLEVSVSDLDKRVSNLETSVSKLQTDMFDLKLIVENEIRPNINLLVEGHSFLVNRNAKLDSIQDNVNRNSDTIYTHTAVIKHHTIEIDNINKRLAQSLSN